MSHGTSIDYYLSIECKQSGLYTYFSSCHSCQGNECHCHVGAKVLQMRMISTKVSKYDFWTIQLFLIAFIKILVNRYLLIWPRNRWGRWHIFEISFGKNFFSLYRGVIDNKRLSLFLAIIAYFDDYCAIITLVGDNRFNWQ